MRFASIAVIISLSLVTGWSQGPASAKYVDPLIADPSHYHLEMENQWVRVFREHMDPHGKLVWHKHPDPGAVVVYMTDQNVRQVLQNGTTREVRHKFGDVAWWPASTHESENLADTPFECIQVEPRGSVTSAGAAAESTDPVVIDPSRYHVEFENERVRVIRATVGPHEKLSMHKHPETAAIVIYLTDQDMRQGHADGTSREGHNKMGTVRFAPKDTAHQDENLSDKPFKLIRIELKQAL
jgi:quercetin dioxygenase-like cupin family protein